MLAVNLFALYSHAAQHFTFKLRAPPPTKKVKISGGGTQGNEFLNRAHFIIFVPGR